MLKYLSLMKQLISFLMVFLPSCDPNCGKQPAEETPDSANQIELKFAPEIVEFEGFINDGTPIDPTYKNADGEAVEIIITESRIEEPIFSPPKAQKK